MYRTTDGPLLAEAAALPPSMRESVDRARPAPLLEKKLRPAARPSSKAALRLQLYVALFVLDIVLISTGFVLGDLFRFGYPPRMENLPTVIVMLPVYLLIAFYSGAYATEVLQAPRIGVNRALRALAIATAFFVGFMFYLKVSSEFSRLSFAYSTTAAVLLLTSGRWWFGRSVGRAVGWRFTNDIVLVDGVRYFPQSGEIVVFADQIDLRPTLTDPALLDRAGRLFANCDRIILACEPGRRAEWCQMLRGAEKNVEVLTPELDAIGGIGVGRLGNRFTLVVNHGPMCLRSRVAKRALDLALVLPLLLLSAPLMILAAIAIRLETPGPAFFRQPRVGQGNRVFKVLKFRSMRVDRLDSAGNLSTQRNDDRITRVGKFIRKTSIDELPQLLNVLRGDMSIVGPRPHALGSTAEDDLFWIVDERYWQRHSVKPGITGLAQVRGFRGATEARDDVTNRVGADLEYIRNWSLARDLLILARTIGVVIHKRAF